MESPGKGKASPGIRLIFTVEREKSQEAFCVDKEQVSSECRNSKKDSPGKISFTGSVKDTIKESEAFCWAEKRIAELICGAIRSRIRISMEEESLKTINAVLACRGREVSVTDVISEETGMRMEFACVESNESSEPEKEKFLLFPFASNQLNDKLFTAESR